jgi:hypothetical protein
VKAFALPVLICLLAVACPDGSGKASKGGGADTLTTRQRDSVIGESRLPGARGVTKALELVDSANARTARIDSGGGL